MADCNEFISKLKEHGIYCSADNIIATEKTYGDSLFNQYDFYLTNGNKIQRWLRKDSDKELLDSFIKCKKL